MSIVRAANRWVLILALWGLSIGCSNPSPSTPGYVTALFSPRGGCTEAIVSEIQKARRNVLVQAYSFTSDPIVEALIGAHRRGVEVEVVVDKSQAKGEQTRRCHDSGIPTRVDSKHAIAHNKIIVIDGETIITGSFNFSKAAEDKNAENLLILKGHPDLVRAYQDNFRLHADHSNRLEE